MILKREYGYVILKRIVFLLTLLLVNMELFGQPLCDESSCITVSLAEVDGTLQTIPGYEDIGDTILFCGYENISILGIFAELEYMGDSQDWSFNGAPSNDAFYLTNSINDVTTIFIQVDFETGGIYANCTCQVTLNRPTYPEANDIAIPLCNDNSVFEDYDLSTIDQDIITSSDVSITYHNTQVDAEIGIDPINLKTVVNGTVIYARVEDNLDVACFSISSVTFQISQNPTVSPTSDIQTLDCNNSEATISANAAGGTPPYTYDWSNVPGMLDAPTLQTSMPDTYMIIVTDNNGCISTESIAITQNIEPPQNVMAQASGVVDCDGNSVTLMGGSSTPNVMFSWAGPNGFAEIGNPVNTNIIGNYTLTVTRNDNGCAETDMVTVSGVPLPTPMISPNTPTLTCSQMSVELIGTCPACVEPVTYQWTGQASGANITVSNANTYVLSVTDANGCGSTTSVVVDESNALPTPIIEPPDIITCEQNDAILDASSSIIIGATATYEWTTLNGNIISGANTSIAIVNASGTYQLEITNNDNGCSVITQQNVIADIVQPVVTNAILFACDDDNTGTEVFNLNDATVSNESGISITYHLSESDATSGNGTLSNANAYISNNRTVYARVEFDDTGCFDIAEIDLSVSEDLFVGLIPDDPGCDTNDGSIISIVTGGTFPYTFNWSGTTQTDSVATDLSAGNYILTVTDTNGCEGSDAVELFTPIPPDVDLGANIESCQPSDRTLNSGYPNSIWSTGETGQTIQVQDFGTYSVTVTDDDCATVDDITFSESDLKIEVSPTRDTSITSDEYLVFVLDGADSYSWEPTTGLSCATCSATQANPEETTIYAVTATTDDGCETTVIIRVEIGIVPNTLSPDGDGINDELVIEEVDNFEINQLSIYNRWGQLIYHAQPYTSDNWWDGTYKGKPVPAGNYYYILELDVANNEIQKGRIFIAR